MLRSIQRLLARIPALLGASLIGLLPGDVHAQSGGGYDLSWNTIDGGGATFSTGGGYSLGGTIGQPDAGQMTGGPYTLGGGFWRGGGSAPTAVEPSTPPAGAPLVFRLHPSAPNPFNPRTRIQFDLPQPGTAELAIYNLRGARVRTLQSGTLPAGRHELGWDGTDDSGTAVASGSYVVRLQAGVEMQQHKVVLLK